jgi:hypothetical protein
LLVALKPPNAFSSLQNLFLVVDLSFPTLIAELSPVAQLAAGVADEAGKPPR